MTPPSSSRDRFLQDLIVWKMLSKFARSTVRATSLRMPQVAARSMSASVEGYGEHLFKGKVAAPYLEKQGLPVDTLESSAWTTNGNADKVRV